MHQLKRYIKSKDIAAHVRVIVWIGASTITAVVGKLIIFVAFVFLARNLDVDEYARFGIYYSYLTAAAVFTSAGIYEAIVSISPDNNTRNTYAPIYSNGIGYFVTVALFVAIVFGFAYLVTKQDFEEWLIACVSVSIGMISAFVALQSSLLRLSGELTNSLKVTGIFSIVGALGMLAASYHFSFITPILVSYGLSSIIGMLFVQQYVNYSLAAPSRTQALRFLQESLPYILIAAIGWLSGYGMNSINSVLLNASEIATYTFLITISSSLQIVGNSVNMYWGPRVINYYRASKLHSNIHSESYIFYATVSVVVSLISFLIIEFYEVGIRVIGGNVTNYGGKSLELTFILGSLIMSIPWWNVQHYYHANSSGPLLMRVNILVGLPSIIVWITLIFHFGEIGLYVGLLLATSLRSLALSLVAKSMWHCNSPITIAVIFTVLVIYYGSN